MSLFFITSFPTRLPCQTHFNVLPPHNTITTPTRNTTLLFQPMHPLTMQAPMRVPHLHMRHLQRCHPPKDSGQS